MENINNKKIDFEMLQSLFNQIHRSLLSTTQVQV